MTTYPGDDRREEIRYKCLIPVEVWVEDGNIAAVLNECIMVDISDNGMRISTKTDFSPVPIGIFMGQIFRIAVMHQKTGVFTAWCRPVWVQKKEKIFEMGLVILRMEKESRDVHRKLVDYLAEEQILKTEIKIIDKLKKQFENYYLKYRLVIKKKRIKALVIIILSMIIVLLLLKSVAII
ncbi:MAG: PilZ domain-containing protein [Candidatus Hydrogenedentota bacterium]